MWAPVGFCVWPAWCRWVCGGGPAGPAEAGANSGGGGRVSRLPCDCYKRGLSGSSVASEGSPGWRRGSQTRVPAPRASPRPPATQRATGGSIGAHGHYDVGFWRQTDPGLSPGAFLRLSFLACEMGQPNLPPGWWQECHGLTAVPGECRGPGRASARDTPCPRSRRRVHRKAGTW